MGIKVEHFRNTGYCAQCNECAWEASIFTKETPSVQDVRNAIGRHIRQTGHTVNLEAVSATHYSKTGKIPQK